ncbi:hypothetical protein [Ferrimonas sp. SCSIO 43195]|uniref:hypothetical protein n=1 Tax=Ferrimonas sp. SCSIO 43195 TaxID=2822844 RepID=UPI002074F752|nr:hypothetical protein [Ferrimonas sp. SCSIO 43195]USD37232.1 hypothetical protein J8Z22_19985 [Ferrimonas sp. SCSIO 43195]
MPYTSEYVIPRSYADLGAEIQHIDQQQDRFCPYPAAPGQCEYYGYKDVAYSVPEETDSTGLDDMVTTMSALQHYVDIQAGLWGLQDSEALMAVAAFSDGAAVSEAIELIAFDLQRLQASQPGIIDADLLSAAAATNDRCTDSGTGPLSSTYCQASRYVDGLQSQPDWQPVLDKVVRAAAQQYQHSGDYFDALCASVPSAQMLCQLDRSINSFSFDLLVAQFGPGNGTKLAVQGVAYKGDNNKGGYLSGRMVLPNNLSSFPEFDAKVFNHELTHFVIDQYMSGSGVTFYGRMETRLFEEGIPVAFAEQQTWTWEKLAELAQSGGQFLLTQDNYNTRGSLVNYLLVAKTAAEARVKHQALLTFIKTISIYDDIAVAFDHAGFTNHKGQAITLDQFGRDIATWVTELANDADLSQYKTAIQYARG